ncbi:MAG: TraQ conjugal transfer family protein [Tannerellaceae bacterium]
MEFRVLFFVWDRKKSRKALILWGLAMVLQLFFNDLKQRDRDVFRLYYTSHCTDQQRIDVCIYDNLGR